MDKPRFETPDLIRRNIDKLAGLFPGCVTDVTDGNTARRAVNFGLLKQMLSDTELEGEEVYEFTWVGKRASVVDAYKPIRKTLRPCPEESRDWDHTQNLYLEGDNLDVLKLMLSSYLHAVKLIYIDPPYNTGGDLLYQDDYTMSAEEYAGEIGERDEDGSRLFRNTDANGRFHSDWCSMIYPRLLLARELLHPDGVILISIDDNEQASLRKICDEVFGGYNFIAQIVWEKVHTRKNSAINFSSSHEYILCYAKTRRNNINDREGFLRNLLPREQTDAYHNPDNDPNGPWKTDPITAHNYYSADYTITKPDGTVIKRPQDRFWAYSEATIQKLIASNAIVWGEGDSMPLAKRYLKDVQDGLVPTTLFTRKFAGDTSLAKRNLDELFPECKGIFDYSKPVKLLRRLIQIGAGKDDIILDFFSGSSTTAQAVMELNAEDGGQRKFIMVQLAEPCGEESEAFKAGYRSICEIGKERIRRAGDQIRKAAQNGIHPDTGFRVFRLDDSNMADVYYSAGEYDQAMLESYVCNIKPDRTDLDLLFGCMLEWGLPLSLSCQTERLEGCSVHTCGGGDLVACFDANIPECVVRALAQRRPRRAVFRDAGFAGSPEKINVFEIFKLYAPDTRVKVI